MKKYPIEVLVPGIFVAAALALAVTVGAQASAPVETEKAAPMTGHHNDSGAAAEHDAEHGTEMKANCQAVMAKKQKMHDECLAMDAKLDKLVAEMNAAGASKKPDAMEKPMAAVITELVAQRKAHQSMMMEMQPEMMAHMMHHQAMGGMDCPMMQMGKAPEPAAETMPAE